MRRLLVIAGCFGTLGVGLGCATAGAGSGSGSGSAGGASSPGPAPGGGKVDAPAPTGGRGPAVSYQPVSNAGYILRRRDSLILHLPGDAVQQQSLDRTAFLRLTLSEAGGGYRATIVIDSLQATASAVAVPDDSLRPVRGTRWTATVSPTGRISDLSADRSTTLGDQLTNHLRALFPVLPGGGARSGAEWSDSTGFPLKADAFDAVEQARTTYRAADDGGKGLRVESSGTYTRTGKGVRFNQQLEMISSGKRQGVHRLGRDGVLVSAEGTDSGNMTITVPSAGQTVPVEQSGRYEVRATGR